MAGEHSADNPPTKRSGAALAATPVIAFAVLALIFYFGLYRGDPSEIPSVLLGKPAPQDPLPPLDGLKANGQPVPGLDPATLKAGQVTVVNVWASWCGPCRTEHPFLMRLAQRGDVQMVGINYKDQPDNARRFLGLLGNPFSAVGVDTAGRASVDWGVYGVPETFIIDAAGIVRYKHIGPINETSYEQRVLPAIEAAR